MLRSRSGGSEASELLIQLLQDRMSSTGTSAQRFPGNTSLSGAGACASMGNAALSTWRRSEICRWIAAALADSRRHCRHSGRSIGTALMACVLSFSPGAEALSCLVVLCLAAHKPISSFARSAGAITRLDLVPLACGTRLPWGQSTPVSGPGEFVGQDENWPFLASHKLHQAILTITYRCLYILRYY